ncbi:DUF3857 domain-containing protein [Hymenobacter latericus]|uniref:DUF3857 domain-containing protein n=1 Tax=Hymenobacter sp. YIM 151858-1 TaxID=2987688 RepID=UPI002225D587|nr:DUF3857 domain-containing protein [Hymenobacter sp. YIM 151858-1]UYZ57486.1 DUF3857 domain-containing protein [Hymenobacter sp. YIM 151858-1]
MKHCLPLLLTLAGALGSAAFLPALGQADPIKFGKIEAKEFDAAAFKADSAANAVILCDFGRTRFNVGPKGNFQYVFERTTRIKILKKGGYEWADVQVPLYHKASDEEKVSGLHGYTYNMGANGQIEKVKLETSSAFTEKASENITLRKFTMPAVREGSVIEYTYTLTSDFLFNFQDWQFQHSIPVRWSEYRAAIPEYFDYKQLWQGYEPLAVQERNEGNGQYTIRWSSEITPGLDGGRTSGGSVTVTPRVTHHRWAMQNVPALHEEPYMTTTRDYVSRLDFELSGVKWPDEPYRDMSSSWPKMQQELLESENFGMQLRKGGFLKAEIDAIVQKHANPLERAAAVHDLVRRNVKASGTGLYATGSIRKTWEQHRGTAADANLLLITLLRDAGLKANPLILSTREHGYVNTTFPLLSRFNYVVAHVQLPDSQQVLADATEELAPFGMLPAACLNGQGRLITSVKEGTWVPLQSKHRFVHFRSAQLTLDERGSLTGKIRDEGAGYLGLVQRNKLREHGEKKYVEGLLKNHGGWKIDKFAFQNVDALGKPLALDLEVRAPGESEQPLGTIYLNVLQTLNQASNPFLLTERRFPVDFGTLLEETNMVTLTIPDNYTVEEMPASAAVELPDGGGRFLFSITPMGNKLQITSRMVLSRALYLSEEYPSLREFYARMLAKQSEKIVLKRKS